MSSSFVILEAAEGRAQILRHVDRRAVAAQQQFFGRGRRP